MDNPNLGTMGSIKKLAESMGDLSARLDAYNLYLPKQARWQAELFLEDRKRDTQVNSALSDVRALSDTAAKLDRSSLPARFELMLLTLVLFSLVAWILLRRFSTWSRDRTERFFHRAA